MNDAAMEAIRDVLDTHDIDDYAEDDGETGIHCIECGWKGQFQWEANLHLAKMINENLQLTEETHSYPETVTKAVSGGQGVLRYGGQMTRVIGYRTDTRLVSPWIRKETP